MMRNVSCIWVLVLPKTFFFESFFSFPVLMVDNVRAIITRNLGEKKPVCIEVGTISNLVFKLFELN